MMEELESSAQCLQLSVILVDGRLFVCTSNGQDWTHVNIPPQFPQLHCARSRDRKKLIGEDQRRHRFGASITGNGPPPSAGKVDGKWHGLLRRR